MFTKKPEKANNWKENSLNGPPDQHEDKYGKKMKTNMNMTIMMDARTMRMKN